MAEKFFPLKAAIAFGVDAQGRPVKPTLEFVRQWDALFKRVGEYQALTNTELEALSLAERLRVFEARTQAPLVVRKGTGPLTITQDISGFTVSIDLDQIIGAVRAFLPRQEVIKQPSPDEASWVIANRIFGA